MKRLSHDYGFLLSTSLSESVYFNVSQITDGEGGDSERLLVGSQVGHRIYRPVIHDKLDRIFDVGVIQRLTTRPREDEPSDHVCH